MTLPRPATLTDSFTRERQPISGVDRGSAGVSPGAEGKARLPVQKELHCEALTGVADPITTWPSEVDASTQEGG